MPVLAPPRVAGPGNARPNFSIERGPPGRAEVCASLGVGNPSGSATTIAATPNAAAVGDLVLISFAWAVATQTLNTVTDTSGNSWTVVSTPAPAQQSGGYAYTIVTTGWGSGANTVTATLSATGGGRVWAAVVIPAAYSPVHDFANAAASSALSTVEFSTTSPLSQLNEVVIVPALIRTALGVTPRFEFQRNFQLVSWTPGVATAASVTAIGAYDDIEGPYVVSGRLAVIDAAGPNIGYGVEVFKITYPGGGGPTNWTQNINDSITVPDSLSFDIGMNLADSVTPTDALAFDRAINVSDSVTAADAAPTIETGKGVTINDSVTVSDALVFDRGLVIADSVTPTDTLAFQRAINIADSATVSDALSFARDIHLSDSVALSDVLAMGYGLGILDSVTAADALTFARDIHLADSMSLADALSFDRDIHLADALTILDQVTTLVPAGVSATIWRELVCAYFIPGGVSSVVVALAMSAASSIIPTEAATVASETCAAQVYEEVV